jgi:hypothetical protein
MQAITRSILASFAFLSICSNAVQADSEKLDLDFNSASASLTRALSKLSVKDKLIDKGCLPGSTVKRTVCTFSLSNYLTFMVSSEKGSEEIVSLTMICSGVDDVGAGKCLVAYAAGVSAATKDLSEADRGKILALLISAIPLGDEASIKTLERRYIIQKGMGIWLHVYAADAEDGK